MQQAKNIPPKKLGAVPQKSVQQLLEKNRTKNQALKKLLKFIEGEMDADANVKPKNSKKDSDKSSK